MTGYQVGDRVRVVIEDATVHGHHGGAIGFIIGRDSVGAVPAPVAWLDPTVDGVTITRRAPQPQAGDVWQLADGEILQFFMASGVLEADDPHDSGCSVPAADLDLTDAELLFRLDAAEPKPAGMLRRFRDGDRDLWTETAPGSGSYTCPAVDVGSTRRTRDQVADAYGRLVDLEPIPAPTTPEER